MSKNIDISTLKINEDNPRTISEEKLNKLKTSLQEFPKMMKLRPIVVDKDNVVLGGNMRLRALRDLGFKKIPGEWVRRAEELTEDEKKRFIIADNVGFGEWQWEVLSNEWEIDNLEEWGLDVPIQSQVDKMDEGEEVFIGQSIQVEPPKEYVLIIAEPNSEEWEELKEMLRLGIVRRGGYKKGSVFDAVSLERVLMFSDFKRRVNDYSSTE